MLQKHETNSMPEPLSFRKLLGPSFILLGLGLGSGEIILWPYLTSNFGMGIIWGAILGITFQFFINMEIERYALVRGESVFVGFARKFSWAPVWFIFSTLAGFVWPGIVAASAKLIGSLFGVEATSWIAILMLILMGAILTLGPVLYKTMERFSMALIGVGVPVLFYLTLRLASGSDWQNLLAGIVGQGNGYWFLPVGIPIATFLAAFAFSGAGGNLNLAQSFYIKEKGYGMGKFGGKITSILTGKSEKVKLEGTKFEINESNLSKFKKWWRLINLEHLIVFWATGAFSICLLALLAYVTAYGSGFSGGIDFVIHEATAIAAKTIPFMGSLFLVLTGLMLFSTQMTVFDATSRIMSENLLILRANSGKGGSLPRMYYTFLWAQIAAGIIIFSLGLTEPLTLLIIEAVINAVAMFVHIGATTLLNVVSLEKSLRPSLIRLIVLISSFLFFGFFSFKTIINYL